MRILSINERSAAWLMVIVTALAVFVLYVQVQTPATTMTAADAEKLADKWWSTTWGRGAAWKYEDSNNAEIRERCYVGVCDGVTDVPGKGGQIDGEEGAYYNRRWEAKYQSPSGKFYKNPSWFGYGKTWEDALYAACEGGHDPQRKGKYDWQEEERFLKSIGKPLIRDRKGEPIK